MYISGSHLLQIPGPTNVPRRVLEAIAEPTLDHRGAKFAEIARSVLQDLGQVYKTRGKVVMYPASGTGAWEAALSNLFSPGDRVLMFETGHFASLWHEMACRLGLEAEILQGDWRGGVRSTPLKERLSKDAGREIRAVCVVHNETSTGAVSDIAAVRKVLDDLSHPAMLIVDTISSGASIDYRHDEWGVDVTVAASQKGLMLPPGLSFNIVSDRALESAKSSRMPKSYWAWQPMLAAMDSGYFPYTPASNLVVGLRAALDLMLHEEGLENVFSRHARLAQATRECVEAWGLELQCANPDERSNSLTAVRLPKGFSADGLRAAVLDRFGISLGNGLGRLADRVFRIGHLGDFNEPMLVGTLASIEISLRETGLNLQGSGVEAALTSLSRSASERTARPNTVSLSGAA